VAVRRATKAYFQFQDRPLTREQLAPAWGELVLCKRLRWCTTGVPKGHDCYRPLLALRVLPAKRHVPRVEPRGLEPLASAVQMRPDESASVRIHPKCAANPHILVNDIGSLVRLISLATAQVGVRLVSRFGYRRGVGCRNGPRIQYWSTIGEGRRCTALADRQLGSKVAGTRPSC
jgi:hypothetical protein